MPIIRGGGDLVPMRLLVRNGKGGGRGRGASSLNDVVMI